MIGPFAFVLPKPHPPPASSPSSVLWPRVALFNVQIARGSKSAGVLFARLLFAVYILQVMFERALFSRRELCGRFIFGLGPVSLADGRLLFGQNDVRQDSQSVYRIGNDVSAPMLVYKVEPQYSEEARRAHVETAVLFSVVVRPDGSVTDLKLVRPAGFGLDEQAEAAVGNWRFRAGTRNGSPVAVAAQIEVNFRLYKEGEGWPKAYLNFVLPPGAKRPELVRGRMPKKAAKAGAYFLKIRFHVDEEGNPQAAELVECTDTAWGGKCLREVRSWRFYPATLDGRPAKVEGVFEFGTERGRSLQAKQ